ncbi:major facilitator superfamily domain-containing protein [Fennellomyces sp. T-0311]|nr:major facilitator superfamily domain-containing protein [Fennellomyces sp. T-0311]
MKTDDCLDDAAPQHQRDEDSSDNIFASIKTKHIYSTEEWRLLRKIIIAVIPLLSLTELVQLTDKLTLNMAGVMGIYEDTGITMSQFSWLGSLYYLGYMASELPNAYLMQKFPVSKYFGFIVTAWGLVLFCTSFGKNFSELAGLRFLMGLFEGVTSPVCLMILGLLFRRREQIIFIAFLEIASEMALVASTLIVYAIGYMEGLANLSSWKWCMIIWGSVTMVIGACVFVFLPDSNDSRWLRLTAVEKDLVKERTSESGLVLDRSFKVHHIYEALKEPRLYCYFFITVLLFLQNGCMGIYSSQIIRESGFTSLNAILLNIPRGIIAILITIMAVYTSYRIQDIGRIGAFMCVISFTGPLVLHSVPHGSAVGLLGVYTSTIMPAYILTITSCSCNVSGYTKRTFYNALIYIALCIGNFVGPLIMFEHEAPRFLSALKGYMIADLIAAALFIY